MPNLSLVSARPILHSAIGIALFGGALAAAEAQQINRCVVNNRVVFQATPCPPPEAASKPAATSAARPDPEAMRAEQARRREELQKGFAPAPPPPVAVKKESQSAPPPRRPSTDVVDCTNLSLYAKAKGHGFVERAIIVEEAKNAGRCF